MGFQFFFIETLVLSLSFLNFEHFKRPFHTEDFLVVSCRHKKLSEIEYMHFYGSIHTSNFFVAATKKLRAVADGPIFPTTQLWLATVGVNGNHYFQWLHSHEPLFVEQLSVT